MEAVRHRDGPILVLAGPGSGKTAVLTEHIRFLTTEAAVDPASVLALTFSKKAANEMRHRFLKQNRLHSTSVTFGTFHSIFYNVLRQYNKGNPPEIATLQEQIRFLQENMRKHGEKTVDAAEAMRILQDIAKYSLCDRTAGGDLTREKSRYAFRDRRREKIAVCRDDACQNQAVSACEG